VHGWSRAVLAHQIEGRRIDRAVTTPTNFGRNRPSPQSDLACALLKDPYDFAFLAATADISERQFERGLLDNLRELFLELGKASPLSAVSITSRSATRTSTSISSSITCACGASS
jgi:predicted nuclease of restriction endonuclease-like (RecB) superfamily